MRDFGDYGEYHANRYPAQASKRSMEEERGRRNASWSGAASTRVCTATLAAALFSLCPWWGERGVKEERRNIRKNYSIVFFFFGRGTSASRFLLRVCSFPRSYSISFLLSFSGLIQLSNLPPKHTSIDTSTSFSNSRGKMRGGAVQREVEES